MLNEITFAHPKLLYLLLVIPLMVVFYLFRHSRQQAYLQLSDASMLASGPKGIRVYLRHMLFVFRQLAIALLIVALARPQSSSSGQDVRIEGIDIVIALDVSGSMLARDIKPDRMEASKEVASEFIQGRPNDRMGLVIFSGETFTQVPLTTDRNVLLNMFDDIKSGMIEDGTAIGDGLATSVGRLRESKAISKVIILLTDGANNAGSVDPLTAAEIARVFGVQIRDIKADIDEPLLKEIANMTEGKYYRATDNKKLEEIFNEIDQLEKSKIDVTEFKRKYEEFLPLALLAFAFLLAEFVLRQTVFRTAI